MPPIKPENKGAEITDIKRIIELANQAKCVVYRGGRTPAGFIQCFQARFLQQEIDRHVIFEYIKQQHNVKSTR
jgi:hypothetical protein